MILLDGKLQGMHELVDPTLQIVVSENWNSTIRDYRALIRHHLGDNYAPHFTREQWAQLYDLNWVPDAMKGFFSISHNQTIGGFSYSEIKHGFDVEQRKRISTAILKRTSNDSEYQKAPVPEFLWVAKESAFKALNGAGGTLLLPDLICVDWHSHYEKDIWSFRINSEKTLDFRHNKGFIFSENDILYSIYYQ
ncbi:MAG: hypothetical protein H7061_00445 [Bdellovibrionaceae bacterium]|nr:hypothetical protein [Bdellovibrio sp.]